MQLSPSLLSSLVLSFGLVACGDGSAASDGAIEEEDAQSMELTEKCSKVKLPAGPIQPVALGRPFNGSEDFTFDGRGSMVAKRADGIVRVNRGGQVTSTVASLPGQTLGLRYHPNGNLIGAMVGAGKLVSVAPDGHVTDLVTGLNGPNGVYVDHDSNVWFTEGGGNRVTRRSPDGGRRTFASGADKAQGANGVVVNEVAKRLYYTEYDKGRINRVHLKAQNPSPIEVWTLQGARFDGLVLDACGNIYVVDQGRSKLFRVRIAANGAAAGAPELLATFPVNVSNAQFGSGEGFDPNTLYVVGNPGSVFAVPVGVGGATVPAPAGH
ncbi:MAG TPA: gluconolactonase [Labilithrix sp.]|nr:gluconolactonase [Labilithrix sp.]